MVAQIIDVEFTEIETFDCGFETREDFDCSFEGMASSNYDGPYIIEPTQKTVVVPTAGKTLSKNIIINPLPSCYGLIEWDGNVLTVS